MSPIATIRTAGPDGNERVDAARNRRAILAAADALFAAAAEPHAVSMDEVAAAAGVGKGTLFRRFGDRAGLIRAVVDARGEQLRTAIESGPPPLGPGGGHRERVLAVLDALLAYKLANRQLLLAHEAAPRPGLHTAPDYVAVHGLLTAELRPLVGAASAGWTAHALLAAVRADLVDHEVRVDGMTGRRLRSQLRAHLERLLDHASR